MRVAWVHLIKTPVDPEVAQASVIITNLNGVQDAGVLDHASPKALMYGHMGGLRVVSTWNARYKEEYFARAPDGSPVDDRRFPAGLYRYADFRTAEFHQASIKEWLDTAATIPRWQGIFCDENGLYGSPPPNGQGWLAYAVPNMIPEPMSWATPGLSIFDMWNIMALKAVAWGVAPLRLMVNCDGYQRYIQAAGDGFLEGFVHGSGAPDSRFPSPAYIREQVKRLLSSVSGEIACFTATSGGENSAGVLRLALCTFLCASPDLTRSSFGFTKDTGVQTWHSEYDTADRLGVPKGPHQLFANDSGDWTGYRREFLGGLVLANTGTVSWTLRPSVQGRLWGGAKMRIPLVPPRTGVILL